MASSNLLGTDKQQEIDALVWAGPGVDAYQATAACSVHGSVTSTSLQLPQCCFRPCDYMKRCSETHRRGSVEKFLARMHS